VLHCPASAIARISVAVLAASSASSRLLTCCSAIFAVSRSMFSGGSDSADLAGKAAAR
jgi:hypothetical protein